MQALAFSKPPPIPAVKPIGPDPEPPSWDKLQGLARGIINSLVPGEGVSDQLDGLSRLYSRWARMAEVEVASAAQVSLPYWGARGKMPKLRWAPVFKADSCKGRHPE
eukprot:75161-Pyramimonas_sp.AAC.1